MPIYHWSLKIFCGLGRPTLPLDASRIQIYGYNSSNLTDKVPSIPIVGLTECAIEMQDGGDGKLDADEINAAFAKVDKKASAE